MLTTYVENFRDPERWIVTAYFIACGALAWFAAQWLDKDMLINLWGCCFAALMVVDVIRWLIKSRWPLGKSAFYHFIYLAVIAAPLVWAVPDGLHKYYRLEVADEVIVSCLFFVFCFSFFLGAKPISFLDRSGAAKTVEDNS